MWKSLETTVLSVAKQRLPETIRERRAKLESATAVMSGKMTVGDAARVYLEKVHASVSLKPRSKDYRDGLMDFIKRSWPALSAMDVRKVSERDCQEWLVRFQKHSREAIGVTVARRVLAVRRRDPHGRRAAVERLRQPRAVSGL